MKKYFVSSLSEIITAFLPQISLEIRNEIIRVLRKLRTASASSSNPFDDMLVKLLIDIIQIDIDQVIPE